MGSLFAALTTSVSGLNAQSSAIGNISENLANAQTTGYKSVGTEFEALVTASNSVVNSPGGVTATPQYQNDVQGSITTSNSPTSLAISGNGYFSVQTASTNSLGVTTFSGNTYYTRQGDFTLDKNGYLVNGSGFYLNGYTVNSAGVANTSATAPVQLSALLNDPVATTQINYSANLPSNAATAYVAPASTLLAYDSLGNTEDVNYTWTKTGINTWNLNVSVPSAKDSNGNTFSSTIPFTFNNGSGSTTPGTIGTLGAYSAGTAATPPSPYTVTTPTTTGSSANATIAVTFPSSTVPQNLTLNFGTYGGSAGVTQFSNTNGTVSVSNFSQDGLPQGSFNNLAIDNTGNVSINYSNGTNRVIAQIPIAQFYAQDQLQQISGGAYSSTLASGNPRLGSPGLNGAGTLSGNSLEQSNVDISTQFTDLIKAQQVYSANAKVVTTTNSLLQVTLNMIQ